MSTKIFHGYIISPRESDLPFTGGDIHDAMGLLQDFYQNTALPILQDKMRRYTARVAAEIVDRLYCGLWCLPGKDKAPLEWSTPRSEAIVDTMDKINEEIREERPGEMNIRFEVGLRQLHDGTIMALLFAWDKTLVAKWEEQPFVRYFGYWTSTEPDENCSREEWEQRRRCWDEVFPRHDAVPANRMLFYKPAVEYGFSPWDIDLSPETLAQRVPTPEERSKRIGQYLGVQDLQDSLGGDFSEKTAKERRDDASRIIQWINSEEGRACIQRNAQSARDMIPETITSEMLQKRFNEWAG